jgi:hypothetical protein
MRTLGGEREVLTPTRLLLGIGPPGGFVLTGQPEVIPAQKSGSEKRRDAECRTPISQKFLDQYGTHPVARTNRELAESERRATVFGSGVIKGRFGLRGISSRAQAMSR